jgi:stringent starvation protein B
MHEWMADGGLTPHLVVDASHPGVEVPPGHVTDGKIVLNVSHAATHGLVLGNEKVTFEARFGGTSRRVAVPVDAVLGIYARETGQGMVFGEEPPPSGDGPGPGHDGPAPGGDSPTQAGNDRPKLKIVK